jgi:hypothetical protein
MREGMVQFSVLNTLTGRTASPYGIEFRTLITLPNNGIFNFRYTTRKELA